MSNRAEQLIMEKWESFCNEINAYHDEKGRWTSKKKAKSYSLTSNAKDDLSKDSEVELGKFQVSSGGKLQPRFGMAGPNPDTACGRLKMDGSKKTKKRRCRDYDQKGQYESLTEPESTTQEPLQANTDTDSTESKKSRKPAMRIRISKSQEELDEKDRRRDIKPEKMREKDKIFAGYADLKRLSRGIFENKELEIPLSALLEALIVYIQEEPSRVEEIAPQLNKVGLFSRGQIADQCRARGRYSLQDWLRIQNKSALAAKGELEKPQKAK